MAKCNQLTSLPFKGLTGRVLYVGLGYMCWRVVDVLLSASG